jgi:hypothetical protein
MAALAEVRHGRTAMPSRVRQSHGFEHVLMILA